MVWLGVAVQLPASRYVCPSMLGPHFTPSLERFGETKMHEGQQKGGWQTHLSRIAIAKAPSGQTAPSELGSEVV